MPFTALRLFHLTTSEYFPRRTQALWRLKVSQPGPILYNELPLFPEVPCLPPPAEVICISQLFKWCLAASGIQRHDFLVSLHGRLNHFRVFTSSFIFDLVKPFGCISNVLHGEFYHDVGFVIIITEVTGGINNQFPSYLRVRFQGVGSHKRMTFLLQDLRIGPQAGLIQAGASHLSMKCLQYLSPEYQLYVTIQGIHSCFVILVEPPIGSSRSYSLCNVQRQCNVEGTLLMMMQT